MHEQEFFSHFLGGTSPEVFEADFQDRAVLCAHSKLSAAELQSVISMSDIDSLLGSPATSPADVDLIVGGKLRETTELVNAAGGVDALLALAWFERGASIRLQNVHRYQEGPGKLARQLSAVLLAEVGANAYLTPAGVRGFEPHFDDHDIFVLQCAGRKRWSIYEGYTSEHPLPQRGRPFSSALHRPGAVKETYELSAGQVLYVPRGTMHAAETAPEDISLHVTFSVSRLTWGDLLARSLHHAIDRNTKLRSAVPLSLLAEAGGAAEEIAGISTALSSAATVTDSVREYLRGLSAYVSPPTTDAFAQRSAEPERFRVVDAPIVHIEAQAPGAYRLYHRGVVADLDEAGKSELDALFDGNDLDIEAMTARRGEAWTRAFVDDLTGCGLLLRGA